MKNLISKPLLKTRSSNIYSFVNFTDNFCELNKHLNNIIVNNNNANPIHITLFYVLFAIKLQSNTNSNILLNSLNSNNQFKRILLECCDNYSFREYLIKIIEEIISETFSEDDKSVYFNFLDEVNESRIPNEEEFLEPYEFSTDESEFITTSFEKPEYQFSLDKKSKSWEESWAEFEEKLRLKTENNSSLIESDKKNITIWNQNKTFSLKIQSKNESDSKLFNPIFAEKNEKIKNQFTAKNGIFFSKNTSPNNIGYIYTSLKKKKKEKEEVNLVENFSENKNKLNIKDERIFYTLTKLIKSKNFEKIKNQFTAKNGIFFSKNTSPNNIGYIYTSLKKKEKEEVNLVENHPTLSFRYSFLSGIEKTFSFLYRGSDANFADWFIHSFRKYWKKVLGSFNMTVGKLKSKLFIMIQLEHHFDNCYVNEKNRLELLNKTPVLEGWNDPSHPNYEEKRTSIELLKKNGTVGIRAGVRSLFAIDDDSKKASFLFKFLLPQLEKSYKGIIKDLKIPYYGRSLSGGYCLMLKCLESLKKSGLYYLSGGKYYHVGDLIGEGGEFVSPTSHGRELELSDYFNEKDLESNEIITIKTEKDFLNLLSKRKLYPFFNIESGSVIVKKGKDGNPEEKIKGYSEVNPKLIKKVDKVNKQFKEKRSDWNWNRCLEKGIIIVGLDELDEEASNSSESTPADAYLRVSYQRENDKAKRTFKVDSLWRKKYSEKLIECFNTGELVNILLDEGMLGENYRYFRGFLSDSSLEREIKSGTLDLANIKDKPRKSTFKNGITIPYWVVKTFHDNYRTGLKLYGKWLVECSWDKLDDYLKILTKTNENDNLKVASIKFLNRENEKVKNKKKALICVYTYEDEIDLVREQLRNIGFTQLLCYKTNMATKNCLQGHRSHLICEKANESCEPNIILEGKNSSKQNLENFKEISAQGTENFNKTSIQSSVSIQDIKKIEKTLDFSNKLLNHSNINEVLENKGIIFRLHCEKQERRKIMKSITKQTTKRHRLTESQRKFWLAEKQINEEALTEELKYLIEVKFDQPIWHKDQEIVSWLKTEKEAGRISLPSLKPKFKEKNEVKEESKEIIKKARTKLILKEKLKNSKNCDYLLLTFQDIDRKVVVFPNSFPWKWSDLKIGNMYYIIYSFKEDISKCHPLISFKKAKKILKEKEYFPLESGEIKYDFNFDNESFSSLNESSSKKEFMNPSEDISENKE